MKAFRILAAGLLVVFLSGCAKEKTGAGGAGGSGSDAPAYGDAIVEASIGDVSGFLTAVTSDSASHTAAGYVFNGLVRYDKNLKLEGELAESWEVSPDGKKITFRLRKGVTWHDGAPFTSEDVLFTYQRMIDPNTPTAYAEDFKQVTRAETPDPHTFVVEYGKPFAPALASWGMHVLPKHLLEKYPDISRSPLNKKPVGTGPFTFVEWKTGEKTVFEANPGYFEGRPYLSRVITRVIPDPATMFLELKSGGIDMMALTPLQYTRQTETEEFKKSFQKYRYLSFGYTYLGFRLSHPLFSDKRVRQAIAHAIHKKEIIDGVLFGLGQEATGPYKPGTWVHNPDVKRYPYDPKKAKALLAEAGWVEKGGVLEKEGRTFSFTVLTNAGNESRAKTAAIIQQNLAAVGIQMEIRTLEWAAFINEFVDKRKFDAVILGWNITQDPDQYDIWSSKKTGPKELNFVGFANAEVDRLLEEGRRTFDIEKRKRAYFRIQEILAEEQPYVFLYYPDALPVVHNRIHGIEPAPAGIAYNFIKWYVPKARQRYTTFQP
ncbi:MAG TPA: peptide-binding protein [Candidatus Deferrimicrobiaceae bacterium]|nr:peptide-binding protein [Candidatus Deferrimicrobiaceae bacterium]